MEADAGKVGTHGYSSGCDPRGQRHMSYQTFSVGVFQWVPKKVGKGCKKGKVLVRVVGPCSARDAVFSRAKDIALLLDVGAYKGAKRVTL